MKALMTTPPGGWENTRLVALPNPTPGRNELVIEVKAAGLNPADGFLIEGKYPGGPQPPLIAGRDAAGIVVTPDAERHWPNGTRVVVLQTRKSNLQQGTLATHAVVPADAVMPIPMGWTLAEAAAAPLVYQTAWSALVSCGELTEQHLVVVTGASGGVGLAAVHLAKGLGATVVALSRSPEKRERLREQGADHVLDASGDGKSIKEAIAGITGRKMANLVVETVGGSFLGQAVHWLGTRGKIAVVGILAGTESEIPIPSLMFKQASIHGVLVGTESPSDAMSDWMRIVATLAKAGKKPVIDATFDLADYQAAFDRLRGSGFGKVVVTME